MNELQFYSALGQLWGAMIQSAKTPEDAIIIGRVGQEIQRKMDAANKAAATPEAPKSE